MTTDDQILEALRPMTARRRARTPEASQRAVAYLRVSTSAQDLGPEAQRAAIEAWAAREGVEVVSWHLDKGVSGSAEIGARPGLLAALSTIRSERAGVLVVAKRDRIARSVRVGLGIEAAAAKYGARVVAADGIGNGDTGADEFMRHVLDGVSQFERRMIKDRTKAALQAKRRRGERVGQVPFGYRVAADGVALEPDPTEQAAIRDALELRAAGRKLREIVEELTARGHRPRGDAWHITSVVRILERAAEVGT
jgi:DNA invertase Pin-like site-specific DNA recombinase